ncbi:hypothetical protein BHE74_00025505 [Ensete ventricosum]|uniref:Uncharacterized protein n=1 Tax=Ensete ventricosum TaxID=4639 RepID=A0A426Y4H1_ENSVE|nr:hypothetical protein B296_00028331 [Ensete ventricosum]RWW23562.1 hypothetical protein GW17_00012188 [Ensete ventricosum]RWW67079.1 hypothetical protein BHE74_00025505 [Ensete ventricosum]RZS04720.1 hypothetical protein BHM03_00035129 [Ensete ventricosum]
MQDTTMLNIQSNPKPRRTSSSQQPAESISRKLSATSSSKPRSPIILFILSGETPLDCAPTMLQFKMRKKAEELAGTAQAI